MKTLIIENTWLPGMLHGWGNGYVLIPPGNPLHGKHYDDIDVDVHYGLTFSELVDNDMIEQWACGQLSPQDEGSWIVGFDTAHLHDDLTSWPMEAVQAETDRLRNNLIELSNNLVNETPQANR